MTDHKPTGVMCGVNHRTIGRGKFQRDGGQCEWCNECDPPGYVPPGEHDDDDGRRLIHRAEWPTSAATRQ